MLDEAVLNVNDVETMTSSDPSEDAVVDAAAAPEPEVRREPRDASARRRFLVIEVISLVVIVGLAVALIISQVQLSNQNSLNAERTSAVAAAKVFADDVASYSYRHLHRDFGRVENESTASFRRDFIRSSGSLTKVLAQYKATASAKVLEAGVSSISSDTAVVLVFLNQTVANTTQQGVKTDDSRIKVMLVRRDGRWLLQDLKVVG